MDQPGPKYATEETEKRIIDSWEPRFRQFDNPEKEKWLGQHNVDDTKTRTKITHLGFLGFGVIGSVCSVAYGIWRDSPGSPPAPAALVVIQFDFRAGSGVLRYKSAEISVSFKERRPGSNHPIVRQLFPTRNVSRSSLTASRSSTSMLSSDHFIWPPDEFIIRGKTRSDKCVQEPDEAIWNINETHGMTYQGPFQATVEVEATTALSLIKISNTPWSRDDPIQPILLRTFDRAVSSLIAAPSPAPKLECTSKTSGAVYRVQGIPVSCRRDQFIKALATALNIETSSIRVHSFTTNSYDTRKEMMSVLSFHTTCDVLEAKSIKKQWHLDISLQPQGSDPSPSAIANTKLTLDTHFLGFTVVGNTSADSAETEVDIVAVHGLGGHAYGSFKERGGSYMWLEDSLPAHLRAAWESSKAGCVARVLLYGYDARVESSISFQSIHDLAENLRGSLKAIRPDTIKKRPLIFIGHSLGGLIIKELLLIQAEPGSDEMDMFSLRATGGVLFFGVPHRGMDNSALLSVIGSQANHEFLKSLRIGSPELEKQWQMFSSDPILEESVIFSFFETCMSGTAKMVRAIPIS
ncbi:hypothetical protein FBEOM_11641 [Fusarium beomiforme]|uniref:AB hydrolase-1 domain-containing protein n=1 Tax=Fusarium beomiforme TaxID=44412 RepID=A0A9P5A984_9HYPO|nr:hypothetical protein FBEOM_11641 [Fusarium beomiforme]